MTKMHLQIAKWSVLVILFSDLDSPAGSLRLCELQFKNQATHKITEISFFLMSDISWSKLTTPPLDPLFWRHFCSSMTPLTKTYVFPSQVSDMDFSCFGQSVSSGKTLGFQFPTGEKRFPLKKNVPYSNAINFVLGFLCLHDMDEKIIIIVVTWHIIINLIINSNIINHY